MPDDARNAVVPADSPAAEPKPPAEDVSGLQEDDGGLLDRLALDRGQRRALIYILAIGAIGSALGAAVGMSEPVNSALLAGTPTGGVKTGINLAAQLGIGAFASVFAFFIFNSRTDDLLRVTAIALAAGMFWHPVADAAKKFVQKSVEGDAVVEKPKKVIEDFTRARTSVEGAKTTPPEAEVVGAINAYGSLRELASPTQRVEIDKAIREYVATVPPTDFPVLQEQVQPVVPPELWRQIEAANVNAQEQPDNAP